jgi:hypothetical protein
VVLVISSCSSVSLTACTFWWPLSLSPSVTVSESWLLLSGIVAAAAAATAAAAPGKSWTETSLSGLKRLKELVSMTMRPLIY